MSPEELKDVREKDKLKQRERRRLKGDIINEQSRKKYEEDEIYRNGKLGRNKKWRKDNWDAVYKQRLESGNQQKAFVRWYHNKGKYNPQYVISQLLRQRLRSVVDKKFDVTFELLGCSIDDFLQHLESQFTEGMSWGNQGEWHIDHIKPCSSFDLSKEDEQRKCFHYTNLQPLWAIDNIKKGSKII